jgi:uncharacterized protein
MSMATDLKCPKCLAPMRAIERSGITVDRCMECGGVFLDRGELERLIHAEGEFVNTQARRGYRDDDDFDDDYREHQHQGRPYKKKRRNFLEDIFDFG